MKNITVHKKRTIKVILILFIGLIQLSSKANAQQIGALTTDIVLEKPASEMDFPIVSKSKIATAISYDQADFPGVIRAVGDLQKDVERVTGIEPEVSSSENTADYEIIVGTIGKNHEIDKLLSGLNLNVKELKGKWETFVIATVQDKKKKKNQLVIAGSDQRGTIYGIYELSRQLGVSPWYWWADVPPKKRNTAYVKSGVYVSEEPQVKYRGIFINDEEPAFGSWAREKFGGVNSKMYAHMFELLLRLRANYLWPAMWGKAFNEDDPLNPKVANDYGIVMGTSHHEPMMRAQKEWGTHRNEYGNGEWNYLSNKEGLKQFWRDGFERNKEFENIVTMGMRGDGDVPMDDLGSAEENFKLLERIMHDQRDIIEEITGKPAKETTQIWALYSEVLEYYDKGMDVPDDMIILLCDDNWGNVRRLPEIEEEPHPGGYGIYYHVDLHGAPRAYQWLNMTQIPHMWEQLQLTYDYGVDKIWILNVGDLKPNEYPMDFFLNMAWNPESFTAENLSEYSREFCATQFGEEVANEAADILNTYCKYNSRVTAEMLDHRTYNLQSGEFLKVKDAYMALEARALRQYSEDIPEDRKDAYLQLILHPVRAMANLYDMYYAVAMNRKMYAEKNLEANHWADRVEYCFNRDAQLSADYNQNLAGGKWNHMMDQVHIGYTSWDEPREGNIMPAVKKLKPEEATGGGYVFQEENKVVVMDAEHYFDKVKSNNGEWTIIPDLGRTRSGIAYMPYTQSTEGASLIYKFKLSSAVDHIKLRLILDSTLPFKEGGHRIAASLEGEDEVVWNINEDLTWENNYSKMYPTGAARIIETEVTLPVKKNKEGICTLTLSPLDPGVVFHKVIIDLGGYEQTHLKMPESRYDKQK